MKITPLVLSAMVLVVVGASTVLIRQQQTLQTQLLQQNSSGPPAETADDCSKLAQQAADQCYLRVAVSENDADICDAISKPSLIQQCRREVELAAQ